MHFAELFGKKNSGEIARKRLKFLLVSDRAGCSPELLEMIKNDFFHTVSRYMEIDHSEMTICVLRTAGEGYHGNLPALYLNIPIRDLQNKRSYTA